MSESCISDWTRTVFNTVREEEEEQEEEEEGEGREADTRANERGTKTASRRVVARRKKEIRGKGTRVVTRK
jgi:N12 class adenine-specific DNA methylase